MTLRKRFRPRHIALIFASNFLVAAGTSGDTGKAPQTYETDQPIPYVKGNDSSLFGAETQYLPAHSKITLLPNDGTNVGTVPVLDEAGNKVEISTKVLPGSPSNCLNVVLTQKPEPVAPAQPGPITPQPPAVPQKPADPAKDSSFSYDKPMGIPAEASSLVAHVAMADTVQHMELINAADSSKQAIEEANTSDNGVASKYYQDLPLPVYSEYLNRASNNLNQTVNVLSQAAQKDETGEITRFRNLYMNARDKAEIGSQIAQEDMKKAEANPFTAFGPILSPAGALAKTASLNDVFNAFDTAAKTAKPTSSQDNLTNRILMLAGLPPDQQAQAMRQLRLAEPIRLTLPDGKYKSMTVLHNGYVWGGGKTGVDCSSFVSSLLPGNGSNSKYTTFDFWAMWFFLEKGRIPKPPFSFKGKREAEIRQASRAFTPVNLYNGEPLTVGDILVFRLASVAHGHIFIVRSYDDVTKTAHVIEAAQSKGTIVERQLPLSFELPSTKERVIRPGLWGLRLKQVDNSVCKFRDGPAKQKAKKT